MGKVTKRVSVCLLLAAVIAFMPLAADAARQNFDHVSVDVPAGWQVDETDTQLTFTAPDESAALMISINVIEGTSLEDFAEATANDVGGVNLQAEGEGYSFTFNSDGFDCEAFVTAVEELNVYIYIAAIGKHPQMEALLSSFQFNQ